MTLEETAQLLAIIATVDNRHVTEETILVWHELLADIPYDEARAATMDHLRTSTEYLTPALVTQRMRALRPVYPRLPQQEVARR